MKLKRVAIALLLRGYPRAWRDEYGPELIDILAARPVTVAAIVNVMASALQERVRALDLTMKLGIAAMTVITADGLWNFAGLLEPTTKTLPTVVVTPLMSNAYVLFATGCGVWTCRRTGGSASESGVAVITITFIAGLPVMVVGVLMLMGAIPHTLNPWAVLTAPLFRLPECWIWGAIGGQIGRRLPGGRSGRVASLAVVAAVASTGLVSLHAASQASNSTARFEVASVRPNKSGEPGGNLRVQPGGRVVAINMPLRNIVSFAYQANAFTLVGGPDWMAQERFDINARLEGNNPPSAPTGTASDPFALAMRALLADRFALKVHRETREVEAYALIVARAGGTPGPALKRSTEDCSPEAVRARATLGATSTPAAGARTLPACGMRVSPGLLQFSGLPLSNIVGVLGGLAGRVVVDRTELEGAWEFELTFTPDGGRGLAPRSDAAPVDPDLPSLFAALQEQLGLRLEPAKTPLEVVVIDSVDRPTPD